MNDHDRALLDAYLDERLDPTAQERFERRLPEEPELAAALQLAREIRGALRAEGPELSPEFYARATAQFERRQRRTILGLGLNWSSAGLAAAAMIAAVLFVPLVLRDEIPGLPQSKTESVVEPLGRIEPQLESADTPAPAPLDLASESKAKRQDRVEEELFRESVDEPEIRARKSLQAAAEQPTATTNPRLSLPRSVAKAPPPAAPAQRDEVAAELLLEYSEANSPVRSGTQAERIPGEAVAAGTVVLLHAAEGYLDSDSNSYGEIDDARSKKVDAAIPVRRVLIGARPGLASCAAIVCTLSSAGWEIDYTESETQATVSCALELPDDGRAIHFRGQPLQ